MSGSHPAGCGSNSITKRVTPHTLRHSFAAYPARAGHRYSVLAPLPDSGSTRSTVVLVVCEPARNRRPHRQHSILDAPGDLIHKSRRPDLFSSGLRTQATRILSGTPLARQAGATTAPVHRLDFIDPPFSRHQCPAPILPTVLPGRGCSLRSDVSRINRILTVPTLNESLISHYRSRGCRGPLSGAAGFCKRP